MEVVTIAMHSKNSLDFSDKQLGFITFQPKGCNYFDFQVNIQQVFNYRVSLRRCNYFDFQVNIQRYGFQGYGSYRCNYFDFQVNIQQNDN